MRLVAAIAALLLLVSAGAARASNVNRDANGWTVVAPSVDSQLVYVSATGSDANNGLSTGAPKLTLAAAAALVRDGFPDHLRLKCGDVWTNQTLIDLRHIAGRGTDEPIVFEGWNFSSPGASCSTRPSLQTNGGALGSFISRAASGTTAHIYIQGIDFYDRAKDPGAGGSNAAPNVNGIQLFDGGNDILVEDCWFRFLFNGAVFQYISGPSPQNITVRRNLFTDMYNGGGGSGHAQGMYWEGAVGTNVIEENLFDHNGWNVAGGAAADVFNHHIYVADSQNITERSNMFGTDSSLSSKFVFYGNETAAVPLLANNTVSNNFFYEGEVGLSMAVDSGATTCYATTGCITNASISCNVFSQIDKSVPTGRAGVGWGMELKDANSSSVTNNVFTDFSYNSGQFAIGLDDDSVPGTAVSGNNSVTNNLIYKVGNTGIILTPTTHWTGTTTISGNTIQDPSLGSFMVEHDGSFTGVTYANQVYSPTSLTHLATISGVTKTYAQWLTASSETGSSNTTVGYASPNRTLDTYGAALGLTDAAGYLAAIRTVSKNNWHTEYLAPTINDYIRIGFGIAPGSVCPNSSQQVTPGGGRNRPISYGGWFLLTLFVLGAASLAGALSVKKRRAEIADAQHVHYIDARELVQLTEMADDSLALMLAKPCDRCGEPALLPRKKRGG